jgi:PAS domain S-box-containing protein
MIGMQEPETGSATPFMSFEHDTLVEALASSDEVGVISGIDDLIVDANDVFLAILGLDRSALDAGLDWRQLMPADRLDGDDPDIHDLATGRGAVHVAQLRHRDGSLVPVLMVAFDVRRDPVSWLSIVVDLTRDEHRAAFDAVLARTDPVLESVVMTAPVGIAVVDQRGRVIRANRKFDALTASTSTLAGAMPDESADDDGEAAASHLSQTFEKAIGSGRPVTQTFDGHGDSDNDSDNDRAIVAHAYPVSVDGDATALGVVLVDAPDSTMAERERSDALKSRVEAQEAALEQLQLMLLPDLPWIDGLFVEARYLPAETVVRVGGDWYDCLTLPDGRVALSVGDALGHGLRSIRIMDAARNAIRTLVMTGHSIADTIRHTNTVMCEVDHATACLVILDPVAGDVEYAIAGHPPPLVRRWDGNVDVLDSPSGPLLGAFPDIEVAVGHTVLAPTESLVIYTDGLVERRNEIIDVGVDRLRMALRTAGQQLPPIGKRLVELTSAGATLDDDVCLLVATRTATGGLPHPTVR